MPEQYRALTLWQPWASLIAVGAKRVETRSWETSYRGPLMIHAAARSCEEWLCWEDNAANAASEALMPLAFGIEPSDLPLAAVLAVAHLIAILPTGDVLNAADYDLRIVRQAVAPKLWIPSPERAFGDYREGRFAWVLADVRRLREPVPYAGHQGLWTPPPDLVERVEEDLGDA